jgi:hypothetical protein
MVKLLKLLMFVLLLSPFQLVFSQYSAGGGITTFHGAGTEVNRFGFNAFFEQPQSSVRTAYIRTTLLFPQKYEFETTIEAVDLSVQPQKLPVRTVSKTSFFSVDGGNRVYFINDYDIGFALYGGFHLKGILSSFSNELLIPSNVNVDDYQTSTGPSQMSLLLGTGINAGAKYQLPMRGAITFDVVFELISRMYDPGNILGNEIAPLSLSFNLAYRFDWY